MTTKSAGTSDGQARARIVLLTHQERVRCGPVARALHQRFGGVTIVVERPEPRGVFLKRRVQRLGVVTTAGQLLFYAYGRFARRRAARRRRDIVAQHHLDNMPLPEVRTHGVPSVNAGETIALLRTLNPDVVVVFNLKRIISAEVLGSVRAPFINLHAGITPAYRGFAGAYWALMSGDKAGFGVTVHLVDRGVDTGGILYQATVEPTPEDSYFTYPTLQLAAGLPLLLQAVEDALSGRLRPRGHGGQRSARWTQPTLFEYLRNGWSRGVW